MSERLFSLWLPAVETARPRRPLSMSESTASWSMRFSLRMMISGAPSSSRRLQTVVAVDDPAVEVVQVAGGEAAAVELHHGAQVGRQHRQHGEDHPLRLVAALAEGLHHLQPLGGLLAPLAAEVLDLLPQLGGQLVQVDAAQDVEDGLGAHARLEDVRGRPLASSRYLGSCRSVTASSRTGSFRSSSSSMRRRYSSRHLLALLLHLLRAGAPLPPRRRRAAPGPSSRP